MTTQKKIDKLCSFSPADRFHSVLVTNAIMGLMIAKRAGLIDYEVKNVVNWIVGIAQNVQIQAKTMDVDAETTLNNYLADHWNNVLRIKSTDDARSNNIEGADHLIIPDSTPRISFIARYEYDVKMLYLYLNPLRDWCVKRQINYEGFVDTLKRGRTKAKIDKKRMGKGTRMSLPSLDVLWVNCKDFMDEDIEDEIASAAKHKATLEGDV